MGNPIASILNAVGVFDSALQSSAVMEHAHRSIGIGRFAVDSRGHPKESRPSTVSPISRRLIPRGCLAAWQTRRVHAYIGAHLTQRLNVRELAQLVDLSPSHFSRVFRRSFGATVHRYVMLRRVAMAQRLMLDTSEELSGIAVSCGMSDQSHMTRLFQRLVGTTPAAWRRAYMREFPTDHTEADMPSNIAEQNKTTVLVAFDTLFNKRDYATAERYWSPGYIQHSAHIEPGRAGLFNLIKSLPPTLRHEPGLIMADGEFVILHGRFSGHGLPKSWIAADILRVVDGVLVEHWDVIQDEASRAESRSGLPMFGDRFPS